MITFQRGVGPLRDGLQIVLVRVFQNLGIVGAHVFGEDFLRLLLVGMNEMDRLEVSFEICLFQRALAVKWTVFVRGLMQPLDARNGFVV